MKYILASYNISWQDKKRVESLKDPQTWNIFVIMANNIPAYHVLWMYFI